MTESAGTIRWYSAELEYGFIKPDDGGDEVLLRGSVLRAAGLDASNAYEGAHIVFEAEETGRGRAASRVVKIDVGPDMKLAAVKWYNRAKGFGFLTTGPNDPDIFVHATVLKRCQMIHLVQGARVYVRAAPTPRGLAAIQVLMRPSAP